MYNNQPYQPVAYSANNAQPMTQGMMKGSSMPMAMTTPGMMPATAGYMMPPQVASGSPMTPSGMVIQPATPVFEQSYIENILRLNLGKIGTFYMTYEGNREWNAKVFKGVLEAAGRDHIIISDTSTGQRVILLMVNLDYATFDEQLNYEYPGVIGNPVRRR